MSTQKKFNQTMPVGLQGAGRKQYSPPTLQKMGKVNDVTLGASWSGPNWDSSWSWRTPLPRS